MKERTKKPRERMEKTKTILQENLGILLLLLLLLLFICCCCYYYYFLFVVVVVIIIIIIIIIIIYITSKICNRVVNQKKNANKIIFF